jgi:uncharacterized phage protein (TIGR02220 family)
MMLKLPFAIKDESWYPQNRIFTPMEARIDLLIAAYEAKGVENIDVNATADKWRWSPSDVILLISEYKAQGTDDYYMKDDSGSAKRRSAAQEVINLYNQVFDRKIQLNDYRLRTISARIKEGKSQVPAIGINQFKAVFEYKKKEWMNTDQEKFLTIETLCAAKHFQKYLDAAREDFKKQNLIKSDQQVGQKLVGSLFKTA